MAFPYRGASMSGTFRQGDILLVQPVLLEAIRAGDVVVFSFAQADSEMPPIVHRVQACTAKGLVTQGDASSAPDAALVGAQELIGRVCLVQRAGSVRRVWGGRAGQLWAGYLRLRRPLLKLARLPYRLLRASGLVRRLWRPRLSQVHLTTEEGTVVKYVAGQRAVACWWPEKRHFWCKKPYDLVIERPDGL